MAERGSGGRSLAIDVMRGMTLALMIVVNMSIDAQASYAQLLHADWHGLTLTDTVFPSFLFAVGASLSFTLERFQERSAELVKKVLLRTALIFLCGVLLYMVPFVTRDAVGRWHLVALDHARIPGVLQRIALCYGAAALIVHFGGVRAALVYALVALPLYWFLLRHFGDYSLQGNAVLRLDRALFGDAHLYHGEGVAFDPEGLLSTIPAVVNALAGCLAARYLRLASAGAGEGAGAGAGTNASAGANGAALGRLVLTGAVCIAVAAAWNALLPINKKLWTSSYALCTIGIDFVVFAALSLLVDRWRWRGWTRFFVVLGRNTLFVYLLSEVGNDALSMTEVGGQSTFIWLYHSAFQPLLPGKSAALAYALLYLLACWLVAWWLDRRRIYIKL